MVCVMASNGMRPVRTAATRGVAQRHASEAAQAAAAAVLAEEPDDASERSEA